MRIKCDESLIGRNFGLLTVKELVGTNNRRRMWRCECECGGTTIECTGKLAYGHKTSCGCQKSARGRKLKRYGASHRHWKGHEGLSGSIWHRIKTSAKLRGIPFKITIKEAWDLFIKQEKRCSLTGLELIMVSSSRELHNGANTASLDRIDRLGGYTINNIQWVHVQVNYMKGPLSQSRFFELCRLVAKNNPDSLADVE